MGPADYAAFVPEGADAKENLEIARVTLDEAPGGPKPGFRFTTKEHGQTPLTIQARLAAPLGAEAGDVMLAHFFLRTIKSVQESGEGVTTLIVERAGTFEKSAARDAKAANGWKEFYVPFAMKGAFKPGEARVCFRLGFQKQIVEVAGFEIRNFHQAATVAQLPVTKVDLSYTGMEPDAPWRAAAEKRIEQLRKSALTVQVVDAAGKPVAGATVSVRQTRHAFGFGSAVNGGMLMAPPGADRYAENYLANFNMVTLGNDLKWPLWEKERDLPQRAARLLKEHGIALRGHNLVWPGWRHLPASAKALEHKPDELRAFTLRHVEDEATVMAPLVTLWDVINETHDNHDLMDLCGEHILVDIFDTAKRCSPQTPLYINDYGIVTGDGLDLPHQAAFYKVIKYLQDQHAPLEGIGIQGHFGEQLTPPARVLEILDRFAAFKLPIQMTEYTLMAEDQEADARFTKDMMTVFFSHPSVNAFIVWGAYEKDFKHKAILFDEKGDWTTVGKAWREMVFGKWWTREQGVSGADGSLRVSGFHGNYEVSVTRGDGGKPVTAMVELRPGGTTAKVMVGN